MKDYVDEAVEADNGFGDAYCSELKTRTGMAGGGALLAAKIVVWILVAVHVLKEVFQLAQVNMDSR